MKLRLVNAVRPRFSLWMTPIVLFLISFLTYGIFAIQQGFYWDDWAFAWVRAHVGSDGLIRLFSINRPMRGGVEAFLTLLLGVNPLAWQIYSILMRWLAAVSFWYFLRTLWPNRNWQAALASLFFLVYPGFSQQPLAMTYHYYWTFASLFFLSLAWMIHALQMKGFWNVKFVGSIFLGGLTLWSMEYLFGLELLRPIFLWLVLGRSTPNWKVRLKKTSLYYIPFAIIMGAYLYWRFFLYHASSYNIDMTATGDSITLLSPLLVLSKMANTLPVVSVGALIQIIQQSFFGKTFSFFLMLIYAIVLIGGPIGLTYFFKVLFQSPKMEVAGERSSSLDLLLISILLLVFAGLPFYLTNLPIRLAFPEDRFTLPFIPGVSLLIVSLLAMIRNNTRSFTFAALIIPLAMAFQIHVTDNYRTEWKAQRSYVWQLIWRAPEVRPGTIFISEDNMIFPHNDDEAFAFLLNWAYYPMSTSPELAYEFFWISARLGGQLPGLEPGLQVLTDHGGATFTGTTDRLVVIRSSPGSCLRILDPVYDADAPLLPRDVNDAEPGFRFASFALPRQTAQALPYANNSLAIFDGAQPSVPEWLFGAEPEHQWCYYFEKADLARQQGNWTTVAKLGDKVFKIPFYPDDPAEYLPFIEAYGRLGRMKEAEDLTDKAADINPALRPMLCAAWQRIGASDQNLDIVNSVQSQLKYCP